MRLLRESPFEPRTRRLGNAWLSLTCTPPFARIAVNLRVRDSLRSATCHTRTGRPRGNSLSAVGRGTLRLRVSRQCGHEGNLAVPARRAAGRPRGGARGAAAPVQRADGRQADRRISYYPTHTARTQSRPYRRSSNGPLPCAARGRLASQARRREIEMNSEPKPTGAIGDRRTRARRVRARQARGVGAFPARDVCLPRRGLAPGLSRAGARPGALALSPCGVLGARVGRTAHGCE